MSDRKYRQRGYMDSEKAEPRAGGAPREPKKERLEGAPRGRTAGGFGPEVFKCARCGELKRSLDGVAFDAVCAKCGADLHTCTNCRNFDTSVRWECRLWEQIPARISPKDARNECELFSAKIVKDLAADKRKPETPDDARKAFDALFKK